MPRMSAELEAIMKYRLAKSQQSDQNIISSTTASISTTRITSTTAPTTSSIDDSIHSGISKNNYADADIDGDDDDSEGDGEGDDDDNDEGDGEKDNDEDDDEIEKTPVMSTQSRVPNRTEKFESQNHGVERIEGGEKLRSKFASSRKMQSNKVIEDNSDSSISSKTGGIVSTSNSVRSFFRNVQTLHQQQQTKHRPISPPPPPPPDIGTVASTESRPFDEHTPTPSFDSFKSLPVPLAKNFMIMEEHNSSVNIHGAITDTSSRTSPPTTTTTNVVEKVYDGQPVTKKFFYNNIKHLPNKDGRNSDRSENDEIKGDVNEELSTQPTESKSNNNCQMTYTSSSSFKPTTAFTNLSSISSISPHHGVDVQRMRTILDRNTPPPPPPGTPPRGKKDRVVEAGGGRLGALSSHPSANQPTFSTSAATGNSSSSCSTSSSTSSRRRDNQNHILENNVDSGDMKTNSIKKESGGNAAGGNFFNDSSVGISGVDSTTVQKEMKHGLSNFDNGVGNGGNIDDVGVVEQPAVFGNWPLEFKKDSGVERGGFGVEEGGGTTSGDGTAWVDWAKNSADLVTEEIKATPSGHGRGGGLSTFDITPTTTNIKDDDIDSINSNDNDADDNLFFDSVLSPFRPENHHPHAQHGGMVDAAIHVKKEKQGDDGETEKHDKVHAPMMALEMEGLEFNPIRNNDGRGAHEIGDASNDDNNESYHSTNLPQQEEHKFCNDEVSLTSHPILTKYHKRNSNYSPPKSPSLSTLNPLTQNPILCRYRNRGWYIDEIDPSMPKCPLLLSTSISSSEIRHKLYMSKTSHGDRGSVRKKQQQQQQNQHQHQHQHQHQQQEEQQQQQQQEEQQHRQKNQQKNQQQQQLLVGIDAVQSIAAGVHKQHGRLRVRVAAVIDLLMLRQRMQSTSASSVLRVVVVWQWGYAPGKPVALQNVVVAPSLLPISDNVRNDVNVNSSIRMYDPKTLCVADGLVFLGGSLDGSPVVFFVKPHVRDAWSSNVLTTEDVTTPITASQSNERDSRRKPVMAIAMAVTTDPQRNNKYLAIALDNGTVSVWTYDLAVATNRLPEDYGGGSGSNRKIGSLQALRPLCQLQGTDSLEGLDCSIFSLDKEDEDEQVAVNNEEWQDKGESKMINEADIICTQLTWIPPRSPGPAILLLAAAFSRGVAIYNVVLPLHETITANMNPSTALNHNKAIGSSGVNKMTTSLLDTIARADSLIDVVQLSPIAVAKSAPLHLRNHLRTSDTKDEDKHSDENNNDHAKNNESSANLEENPQACVPETVSVTWLDLGPLVPPCLSVAFQSKYFLRVSIAALDLPLYKNDNDTNCNYDDEYDECNGELGDTTTPRPLSILCEGKYPMSQSSPLSSLEHAQILSTNIYCFGSLGSMLCHQSNGNMIVMYPTLGSGKHKHNQSKNKDTFILKMNNPQLLPIAHPVASAPLGIIDTGFAIGDNDNTDGDTGYSDILHVHSNLHCEIQHRGLLRHDKDNFGGADDGCRNWGIPAMRYWLCKSKVGDKKLYSLTSKTSNKLQQQQRAAVAQEGDFPTGGADLSVICELTYGYSVSSIQRQQPKPLIPHRISRDPTGEYCAVLFRSIFEPKKGRLHPARMGTDPILFLLVNTTTSTIARGGRLATNTLRHGRDVAFLTRLQPNRPRFLLLKTDGSSLEEVFLSDGGHDSTYNRDKSRNSQDAFFHEVPIFPRSAVKESSIEVHRIFVTLKSRVFFVGSGRKNIRYCLFYGGYWTNHSALSTSVLKTGNGLAKLWFHPGEKILSLIELPIWPKESKQDDAICGNIAVATTTRVIILSPPCNNTESGDSKMTIIAEKRGGTLLTCASLVPIGSHCVAFFEFLSTNRTSGGVRMSYLSCLPQRADCYRHRPIPRVIATLPSPRYSYASSYLLIAVRPDRFLYLSSQSGSRLAAEVETEQTFLSPIPCTRPICLLEPLVANALCCYGNDENSEHDLRKLILMRTIIERFGRKSLSIPHGDKEGIGILGAGITTKVYDMLSDWHNHGGGDNGSRSLSYLIKGYSHHNPNKQNHCATEPLVSLSSGTCLPPWIPAIIKAKASKSCAGALHAFASGDHYLMEYIRTATETATNTSVPSSSDSTSPTVYTDSAAPCVMPRPIDPTSALSQKFAKAALDNGNILDAVKFLDLSGSPYSERDLTILILSLQLLIPPTVSSSLVATSAKANIVESLLARLCGNAVGGRNNAASIVAGTSSGGQYHGGGVSSICAIALALRMQNQTKLPRNMASRLAPSFQKGCCATRRFRNSLLGSLSLVGMGQLIQDKDGAEVKSKSVRLTDKDHDWEDKSLEEAKNIWSMGPFGDKEEILLLDRIEEWIGRAKPGKMGKIGAEVAAESGERTLQNILAAAKMDVEPGEEPHFDNEEGSDNSFKEGWVDGVGEGRVDEDNLTLYLRFSEGADEDSNWRTDGLNDLSSYHNKVKLIQSDYVDIEATTSYVDEGETGKVKLLHDLVFNQNIDMGESSGILVEVKRGSSLDTGMLHSSFHESRQRSTIEFWYFLPTDTCSRDIVLARRSVCFPGDAVEDLCSITEKESVLWELVVVPSGRLEFRSGGISLLDSINPLKSDSPQPHEEEIIERDDVNGETDCGLVSRQAEDGYGGWNHVCLTFSSRDLESYKCEVSLIMKGATIASDIVSIEPPGLEKEDLNDIDCINENLERSALMFGVGAVSGLRITDIRCWACKRDICDVKYMMCEYLNAAEIKKKIKIRIRNKGKVLDKGGKAVRNFAPPPLKITKKGGTNVDKSTSQASFSFAVFESIGDNGIDTINLSQSIKEAPHPITSENAKKETILLKNIDALASDTIPNMEESFLCDNYSIEVQYNCLLSKEVRNSAAAALVRGPPATRHFGGNRGGLPLKRNPHQLSSNIGSIAICGSEKTVIFTYDKMPPGKTYPIGASGAIISDRFHMDDNESEYLCCFLAKDKRMVVFELYSKTIVAQLQMTTKLNFWRFLPPVSHGDTLVFLLITPVGGFHWMPLDESPRPRQAWKRTPELQGKKIIAYEEGGSNGLDGSDCRSSIALLLTSSASSSDPVEAWCITMFGNSNTVKVSPNVLGAALFSSFSDSNSTDSFEPFLVTVSEGHDSGNITVEIFILSMIIATKVLQKGPLYAHTVLDVNMQDYKYIPEPAMAMGMLPQAFCLCCGEYVVVILRAMGVLFVLHRVNNKLSCVGKQELDHFVVEAAIRSGKEDRTVDVIALLCEQENLKDGRIVTIHISCNNP